MNSLYIKQANEDVIASFVYWIRPNEQPTGTLTKLKYGFVFQCQLSFLKYSDYEN